ncbi:ArsR family transcriptional regulator [Melghirimyces profundicolus]|uniref:ArsR family transcriptional regulator n=1 Tax=Melghirimyces profundicolus TaxID=1242148 RepID=A0A2T6C7J9_9BACL|nr:metalloregulator ArsR/SmtB family transcription factor [Melghirimyces profundicolus]PTX64299.1 ArsR family transcriptional regulator [Melghirimyces profundicolus]
MMALDQLAEYHKVLGDQTRLRILALLKCEELCVCELVEILQLSQPTVSQHMRRLKSIGLVKERRQGQWVFYSLDGSQYPLFKGVIETLPDLREEIEQLKNNGKKVICN